MRFDVDALDFYDDILAVFDLATVLATFSKSWEFFSQPSGHSDFKQKDKIWLERFAFLSRVPRHSSERQSP